MGVPFGPAIDVWSVGCILAELWTGQPLFSGTTRHQLAMAIAAVRGPFPSAVYASGKYWQPAYGPAAAEGAIWTAGGYCSHPPRSACRPRPPARLPATYNLPFPASHAGGRAWLLWRARSTASILRSWTCWTACSTWTPRSG